MATKRGVILWAGLAGGLVVAVVFLLTETFSTRSVYVDIVNGDMKTVKTAFGLTCGTETNVTDYSMLVTQLGLRDEPVWRLVNHEGRGLRKVFGPVHICLAEQKSCVAMSDLTMLMKMGAVENPAEKVLQLRKILLSEGAMAGAEYTRELTMRVAQDQSGP